MEKSLILSLICLVIFVVGYFTGRIIGYKRGTIQGMQELLSLMKIYSPDLLLSVSEMLTRVDGMSEKEQEKALTEYLNKHSK